MPDIDLGHVLTPSHCQVSVSPDRRRLALTFRSEGEAPTSIVVPVLDAAGLQAKLARSLFLLGVRLVSGKTVPKAGRSTV